MTNRTISGTIMNSHSFLFGGNHMIKTEKVMQITLPTPYAVGDVHVYLLKGDALSLIDAGVQTEEAWKIFNEKLKDFGYEPKDIEQVILTHHHPDHTGLLNRFDNLKGIYGHRRNEPWLTKDKQYFEFYLRFFEEQYKLFGIDGGFDGFVRNLKGTLKYGGKGSLTKFLAEEDALPGHPEWKVIETFGHARSHLSFYNEKDYSFLAGDHILAHISSNPLLEAPDQEGEPRPKPLLEQRESLQKLMDYPIETVYPGHGPIFHGVKEMIPTRLKKQEERAAKVFNFIKEQPLTVFETTKKLFPTKYESQLGLTISETVGQLDYLESIGNIRKEKREEQWVYISQD